MLGLLVGVDFFDGFELDVLVVAALASRDATATTATALGAGVADGEAGSGSAVQLLGYQLLVQLTHRGVLLLNFYLPELVHNS